MLLRHLAAASAPKEGVGKLFLLYAPGLPTYETATLSLLLLGTRYGATLPPKERTTIIT